jgi:hypothetical protein
MFANPPATEIVLSSLKARGSRAGGSLLQISKYHPARTSGVVGRKPKPFCFRDFVEGLFVHGFDGDARQ